MTGFGLLGHAQNLAASQKADVSFRIHTLPGAKTLTYVTCILLNLSVIRTYVPSDSILLYLQFSVAYFAQSSYLYNAVLDHMERVASTMASRGLNFKLKEGFSAETSGQY